MGDRYNGYFYNRNPNRNWGFNYCIDDNFWGWGR